MLGRHYTRVAALLLTHHGRTGSPMTSTGGRASMPEATHAFAYYVLKAALWSAALPDVVARAARRCLGLHPSSSARVETFETSKPERFCRIADAALDAWQPVAREACAAESVSSRKSRRRTPASMRMTHSRY
jgi:hypothetical protein